MSDVRARQAKLRQIILERKAKQEQQEAAEAEARAAKEWEDVIRTDISGESGLRRPDYLRNVRADRCGWRRMSCGWLRSPAMPPASPRPSRTLHASWKKRKARKPSPSGRGWKLSRRRPKPQR